jgi:hypothetical protein
VCVQRHQKTNKAGKNHKAKVQERQEPGNVNKEFKVPFLSNAFANPKITPRKLKN